jgi:large subunit ribosomal protein L31
MKDGIHPNYREVIFRDIASGVDFMTRSTIRTKEVGEWKGKEYPMFKVEISSKSHPFYTGQEKILDTAGRVERFKRKYSSKK